MRVLLLAVILCLGPVGPILADEAPPETAATVVGVKPVSERFLADRSSAPLKVGNQLWLGDRLKLQPSGQVKLILADGSAMKVEGGSELILEKPASVGDQLIRLVQGLVRVVASKQSEGKRLRLISSTAVIAVKGTQFQVEAGELGTELKVLEGRVELDSPKGLTPTVVSAGEAAISYFHRVDKVRKLNFEEVKALRGAFRDLVRQQQIEYTKRVREARGKRSAPKEAK